jgi:hypothetical protein
MLKSALDEAAQRTAASALSGEAVMNAVLKKSGWVAVSLLGAGALGLVALERGEAVNAAKR